MLDGWATVERALNHYAYVFALPHATAQAVIQRAQAALVGKQLANAYRDAATLPDWEAEASESPLTEDLPEHRVILP